MAPVVLGYLAEELATGPLLGKSILEHDPGRERELVQSPVLHDRVTFRREPRGALRLVLRGERLRQIDRDEHDLLVEVPDAELLPDLDEDTLGLVVLPEPVGDLALDSVQAELG